MVLGGYFLPHFRKFFNYYLLKYFIMDFLFVFFFWDSYDLNLGAFNIVPEVSEVVLISFIFFIFFLSASFISTILSSTSLILSGTLGFLDYFLPHFREVFNYYLKYFLMRFLFVFFFWDSYDLDVRAFNIVPELSEVVLTSFNSFFLSASFISTILSSTSLMLSSASVIHLLVPFRVLLISVIVLFIID